VSLSLSLSLSTHHAAVPQVHDLTDKPVAVSQVHEDTSWTNIQSVWHPASLLVGHQQPNSSVSCALAFRVHAL